MKNHIGLNPEKTQQTAKEMNELLANFQIFYINTRGFHWNIQGDRFFELHLKFEELYTDALLKIDEIGERILTLGHRPFHSFSDYLKHSEIKEQTNISAGPEAIKFVLDAFKTLIIKERKILELSAEAGDEGTNSQMSDYIKEQEKQVWMYSAYLNH
jgi:starvation-inducible DNA-binding protein